MSPEIRFIPNYPDVQTVFDIVPGPGEPSVVCDGTFFQTFCAVNMILSLRKEIIKRNPEQGREADRRQRQKAVEVLSRIGMPGEMSREFVDLVIEKIPGVSVRCKTRPYTEDELPKGIKLGEHTGYDFELIRPE